MNFAEVLVGEVGVDLGSTDIGVTEQTLDTAEIGSVHEEVSGKGVTEGVGGDMFGNAGDAFVFVDDALDAAGGETTVVTGVLLCTCVARVIDEERI